MKNTTTTAPAANRAVLYIRKSATSPRLRKQKAMARKFAKSRGITIVKTFVDKGVPSRARFAAQSGRELVAIYTERAPA